MKHVRLNIPQRLLLGFCAVLLLTAVTSGVGWRQLTQAHEDAQELARLERLASMTERWMSKTELNVNRALAVIKANGAPEVEAHFAGLIKKTSEDISSLQKELTESLESDASSNALLGRVGEVRKTYLALRGEALKMQKAKDPEAASFVDLKVLPAADGYLKALAELNRHAEARAKALAEGSRTSTQWAKTVVIASGLACVLVGVMVALLIASAVTRPLRQAVETAERIASGDLASPVPARSGDELGDLLTSLTKMRSALRQFVQQVRETSDGVTNASGEVAAGGADLSSRTEATAASLEQTAASMQEAATTVDQTMDSARTADELARSAAQVATRGGTLVSEVVRTMTEIDASSRKITDIISVIDSIAFQTNILALNAAVEAARAGEQGRGFAVVASEVRSLAQRSATAAKEIKGLIASSVEHVGSGAELVAATGRTMEDMVVSTKRVTEVIDALNRQAERQQLMISQVYEAIVHLDGATQQNATLVEESSAAAQALKQQAQELTAAVCTFRLS